MLEADRGHLGVMLIIAAAFPAWVLVIVMNKHIVTNPYPGEGIFK